MGDHHSCSVPIPEGWSRGVSRTLKRPYYYHVASQHTQWHFPTPQEAKDPHGTKERLRNEQHAKRQKMLNSVAIIVPYRDLHPTQNRARHLQQFVPHMKKFLSELVSNNAISDYHIYIIEQSDDGRKFNRGKSPLKTYMLYIFAALTSHLTGKLLNIGFDYSVKRSEKHPPRHNIFIFHDVDLLPQNDLAEWYGKYPTKPTHIARVWSRYAANNSKVRSVPCERGVLASDTRHRHSSQVFWRRR